MTRLHSSRSGCEGRVEYVVVKADWKDELTIT